MQIGQVPGEPGSTARNRMMSLMMYKCFGRHKQLVKTCNLRASEAQTSGTIVGKINQGLLRWAGTEVTDHLGGSTIRAAALYPLSCLPIHTHIHHILYQNISISLKRPNQPTTPPQLCSSSSSPSSPSRPPSQPRPQQHRQQHRQQPPQPAASPPSPPAAHQ